MKCLRSSTTWCGSVAAVAIVLATARVWATDAIAETAIKTALVEAVQARVGAGCTVTIESLEVESLVASPHVAAVPAPGSRLGGPVRFTLVAPRAGGAPTRVGSARAIVRVVAPHARATRQVLRGAVLAREDVETALADLGTMPIGPLAPIDEILGGRAMRALAPGEPIGLAMVSPQSVVRSGEVVTVKAVVGSVEVSSRAIASQSGARGQVIRLVNPESHRSFRGRVIGAGEVEVVR